MARWSDNNHKADRRAAKRNKRKYGMKVRGRSVQNLQRIVLDKAEKAGR